MEEAPASPPPFIDTRAVFGCDGSGRGRNAANARDTLAASKGFVVRGRAPGFLTNVF